MRNLLLLASAACMAVAMPALAQGKGGGGQGKGGGNPHAAHGGGNGGGDNGRGNERARGNGHGGGGNGQRMREVRAERGHGGGGQGQARRAERRVERHVDRDVRRVEHRIERRDVRVEQRAVRRELRGSAGGGNERRLADRVNYERFGRGAPVRAATAGTCPPGLARQNAFCAPPGQLRRAQRLGQRIDYNRLAAVPQEWQYRFRDDQSHYYRYDDYGSVYRVARDNNLVSSIIPLFSNGLSFGEPMPLGYDVYNVPYQYRDDYADGGEHLYRYDDNAIYRVDRESNLIEGIVALLAGNGLNVGSQLPQGYDAYNLPTDYRDQYVDDADSMYRYANGGIYEVDPTTQLVEALVEMIA